VISKNHGKHPNQDDDLNYIGLVVLNLGLLYHHIIVSWINLTPRLINLRRELIYVKRVAFYKKSQTKKLPADISLL
jgi:hypothetical protein